MSKSRDLGDAANKANFLDNVTSDIQSQLNGAGSPAGTIITFGGTSAPTGYLACQGQEELQSAYPALYAAIGTAWGSASSPASHFKLPDLRGAFLRGTGSNATHNMANGNDFAGQAVGSFENDQFQDFAIDVPAQGTTNAGHHGQASALVGSPQGVDDLGNPLYPPVADGQGTPRVGDETRPFNASILYCIKT